MVDHLPDSCFFRSDHAWFKVLYIVVKAYTSPMRREKSFLQDEAAVIAEFLWLYNCLSTLKSIHVL